MLLLLLLLLLWERVINVPILVLVPPHGTAAVSVQSVGLRCLAQGGTVVLTVLLLCHDPTVAHRPRPVEHRPHGVVCLDAGVVSHLLCVRRHGLRGETGRGHGDHPLVLPRAGRLHREGLKVSGEVQLVHEGGPRGEALPVQTLQGPHKQVGVVEEVHGGM